MTLQWKDTDSDKNCMEEHFERDAKSDVELDHWDMLWHGRWNVKYFLLVCLYLIQPWSHNCQLYRSNFIVDSVIVKNINLYSVDIWISLQSSALPLSSSVSAADQEMMNLVNSVQDRSAIIWLLLCYKELGTDRGQLASFPMADTLTQETSCSDIIWEEHH